MRSRSWLISAWKPKLSEAIFARKGRERDVRGKDGDGEAIEQLKSRERVRQDLCTCLACHSRTFHLHRPMWSGARVLALSGRECSAAFHALLQHLPHSEHTTSLVRAVASYTGRPDDGGIQLDTADKGFLMGIQLEIKWRVCWIPIV